MKYFIILASVFFLPQIAIADAWDDDLVLMQDFEIDPMLYNGTRSVTGEFLMMGWIGNCTGTAVGPGTILTAAHCVRHGATITFRPRYNGQAYRMICSRHPRYNTNTVFNDYAICRLTSGRFPETMPLASFSSRRPAVGERLLLNGYGAPTVRVHHWGPETVTSHRSQDIVTCGRVFLGGGDSGGALLGWSNDRSGRSGFEVLGVNSRSDRRRCSYFNGTHHIEFNSWARDYERDTSERMCGISLDCNGGQPDPDPEPEPIGCVDAYERFAFCLGTSGVESCLDLADKLKACVK